MASLRVNNFVGDRLVVNGPVTGVRYEYIPKRDKGTLSNVLEEDVDGLVSIVRKEGCGCTQGGQPSQIITYNLFERV